MTTYFGKELFILFAASAFRKLSSIYVFSYFPFGFEGRIWDLIVSVPDHCLSFYLGYSGGSSGGSWGSNEPLLQPKLFHFHGEFQEKLVKLHKSNPPQLIWTPDSKFLDPPLNSVSLAGYVAEMGSPGQVWDKFNILVGMMIDFLKLDPADIVFCKYVIPLSCNLE